MIPRYATEEDTCEIYWHDLIESVTYPGTWFCTLCPYIEGDAQ